MTTINTENAKQIRRSMDVIIQITPATGTPIVITNDNLISCVVSLRSDLSIIEQSLPESEINIEAYFDNDISDALASIPDETPVTYQAGYTGDMSPVRNFYLAEQITWADNVATIHAVDAVHKLDREIGTALYMNNDVPKTVAGSALGLIKDCTGVLPMATDEIPYLRALNLGAFIVDEGQTARDLVAQINHFLHQNNDIWYTYVDAGIPKFTATKPSALWDIYEDDCGDVQRNTERNIAKITATQTTPRRTLTPEVGSATMVRNVGTTLSFGNSYIASVSIGVASRSRDDDLIVSHYTTRNFNNRVVPMVPADKLGESGFPITYLPRIRYTYATQRTVDGMSRLFRDGMTQADFKGIDDDRGYPEAYTQFVPWSAAYDANDSYWTDNPGTTDIRSQANARAVLVTSTIISSTEDAELSIGGYSFEMETEQVEYIGVSDGINATLDSLPWFGSVGTETHGTAFPDDAINSLFMRSNITGQFVWKGDPRMQPRDVVTFHRLDGTTEDITLENITITHERGGTSAEITYRKGIC